MTDGTSMHSPPRASQTSSCRLLSGVSQSVCVKLEGTFSVCQHQLHIRPWGRQLFGSPLVLPHYSAHSILARTVISRAQELWKEKKKNKNDQSNGEETEWEGGEERSGGRAKQTATPEQRSGAKREKQRKKGSRAKHRRLVDGHVARQTRRRARTTKEAQRKPRRSKKNSATCASIHPLTIKLSVNPDAHGSSFISSRAYSVFDRVIGRDATTQSSRTSHATKRKDMADSVRPEEFPSPRAEKEERGEDVTMEDVATPSQATDMEEEDNNASVDDHSECGSCSGGGGGATSSLAKFKAAQDLRIQTLDLPAEGKPRANSEDSSTGGVSDTKTPVPSSTGKKRRRRTAAQIDRKYPCTYPGCTKAYGSEGSLTQHQRLKHRNQTPDPQSTQANQSLGNFFLPLHRTPRSLPGNMGRPGSTRTVSIRPAGIDGLSLQPFDVAGVLVPEHDTISGDFLMPSPAHSLPSGHGQHLRARSNSMPVSFASPAALTIPFETSHSLPADCVTPSKPQSTRRSRAGSTPRAAKPPLRRQKSRSKSESLNELAEPIYFQDDTRPPFNSRSTSDTASGFDFNAGPPYDWRYAIARANSESPPSSEDDRIDSEILSVLADYDASDADNSTLELMSSASSFQTARSLSSESDGPLSTSGSLKRLDEEWLSHHDDTYLTTHLEKMSMVNCTSPRDASETLLRAAPLDDMRMVKLEFGEDDEGQVAEGSGSFQDQFPGVSIDSFAITGVDPALLAAHDSKDGLKSLVSRGPSGEALLFQDSDQFNHAAPTFKQEPVLTTATETAAAVAATSELAALATYGSCDMGQADYMDVDSGSYGPLQWKTEKHRSNASQGLFGSTLDSIPSIFHDKHSGLFAPRETTFIMDAVDYAMEEPRLSSPVGEPGF